MKYALNLADDGRILSACFVSEYTPADSVFVDELPEGDVSEYLYVNGQYEYNPLPKPEQPEAQPTDAERITELEEALAMLLSGVTE